MSETDWTSDSSGLIDHCLCILRTTHQIIERLSQLAQTNASIKDELDSAEVQQWTQHVMPCVDLLSRTMYTARSNVPLLEARAYALCLAVDGVCTVVRLQYPRLDHQWMVDMTSTLHDHLDAMRITIQTQLMQSTAVQVRVHATSPW